jgi:uncharacterized repeat protein (TIGR01451 family)
MRVCKVVVRALAGLVIAGGMWVGSADAQTLTVSPTDLSFGVPTGTSGGVSAPQTVTVNIQGSGPVMFSNAGSASTGNGDFAINGNSCAGTLTAPTTCQVSVVFTASQPAGTLESTTLTITSTTPATSLTVPMNGALGSIEIFGALNINKSLFAGTTWDNNPPTAGNPVSSSTISLSCAAPISAILSSTPDGKKNVFQDNTLRIIDTPTGGSATNTPNVCRGGDGNFDNFPFPSGTTNCFQQPFEGAATGYVGQNPDLAGFPNHTGAPGTFIAQYGVPAIDISSLLTTGTQAFTVELDDAGGDLGAAALHLVTNCTLAGTVPGGSITGNPINPNDPSSQTQTFTFNNGGGQNIGFTTSTSTAQQQQTVVIPPNTVPIVTDIGIPQNLFSQLVAGKSSAPAVCLRLTGETDPFGAAMCKGYLIQCQDPTTKTVSGDNCVPNASAARNLLDIARFESPDAPAGQNYLTNTQHLPSNPNGPVSACGSFASTCPQTVIGSTVASTMLVGPGMLLGSDGWICAPGTTSQDLTTCTSIELNTNTTNTGTNYSAANCSLTGSLTGNICPLDTLTEFLGAADPVHGSTTSGKNSIFVPVVNMPLPFTTLTPSATTINGWFNTTAAAVVFTSHPANYTAAAPAGNGFAAAPTYSVTYGVTPSTSPVPDTTYPVTGDLSQYNPGASPNFGKLTPGQSICAGISSPSFSSTAVTLAVTEGIYNLHYFTTDCALTEELLFNPTGTQLIDPTANWASFRTMPFGIDQTAPVLDICTLSASAGPTGWYTSPVTASCLGHDGLSGFAPGNPVPNTNGAVLQGGPTATATGSTTGSGVTASIAPITVQDLAGNTSNTQGPISTPLDNTAPTFSAKFNASGTTFSVGQSVMGTFNCSDNMGGSGVAICGTQTVSACTGTPGIGLPSFNTPVAIDTSAAAVGAHTVRAVDCAGNPSTTSVTYTVAYGSVELAIANIPNPLASVKSGNNLTYKIFVLDLSANTASNVVVTDTIPANAQYVSAMSGIVSCSLAGCNDLTTGSSCSVSGTGGPGSVVTCMTPTVKPILPGLTGYVIKLVVKVSAPASVKSISDTATVTSSNPDTIKGDNTVTVTTKVTQ